MGGLFGDEELVGSADASCGEWVWVVSEGDSRRDGIMRKAHFIRDFASSPSRSAFAARSSDALCRDMSRSWSYESVRSLVDSSSDRATSFCVQRDGKVSTCRLVIFQEHDERESSPSSDPA